MGNVNFSQTKFIINSGTSLFVPSGSLFCSNIIEVNLGGSYITADPSGTCSTATVSGEGEIVFPVELTSFYGKVINGRINLFWTTVTETNNYGFEVQRKNLTNNFWSDLGFVNGSGNSNSPKSYSFVDHNISDGLNFIYRLKQIDTDGTINFSDSIEVSITIQSYGLEQNFPNPFNPITTIEFSLPEDVNNANLIIYNALGQVVAELLNGKKEAGTYSYQWNAQSFASGLYLYRLVTEKFNSIKKMILLK